MMRWFLLLGLVFLASGCGLMGPSKDAKYLLSARATDSKSCVDYFVLGSYSDEKILAVKTKLTSSLPNVSTTACDLEASTGTCSLNQNLAGVDMRADSLLFAADRATNEKNCKGSGGQLTR